MLTELTLPVRRGLVGNFFASPIFFTLVRWALAIGVFPSLVDIIIPHGPRLVNRFLKKTFFYFSAKTY